MKMLRAILVFIITGSTLIAALWSASANEQSASRQSIHNAAQDADPGNNDITGKLLRSLAIDTGIRNLVLLTFGQSNCENVGPSAYVPRNGSAVDNFDFLNGQMYAAADPLLGAATAGIGGPGNIATRIGDLLITEGKFDRV